MVPHTSAPSVPRIAITPGEPAGVGPDLCIQLAQHAHPAQLVAICDPELMAQRARELNLNINITTFDAAEPATPHTPGSLTVLPLELAQSIVAGTLNVNNAAYVLQCLRLAVQGCQNHTFDAMVTGPVHKGIINDSGIDFSGHTEFLAELCNSKRSVMMLQTEGLRVALVTTHLPLRAVADAISQDTLREVIEILHHDLQRKMGIEQPSIYVCGLNPHAGENGHLGKEEQQIIEPVLSELRAKGLNLVGPLPADTIFTAANIAQSDVILAMYHDQGLPVLKHLGFGNAINVTLGLPIVRTSVDHGTALELAGSGKANSGSLEKALQLAIEMVKIKPRFRS